MKNIEDYCAVEYDNCFMVYECHDVSNKISNTLPINACFEFSLRRAKPMIVQGLPHSIRKYIEKFGYTINVGKTNFKKYVALVQTPLAGKKTEVMPEIYTDTVESFYHDGILKVTVEEGKIISKLLGNRILLSSIKSINYELSRFISTPYPLKPGLLA